MTALLQHQRLLRVESGFPVDAPEVAAAGFDGAIAAGGIRAA